MFKIEEKGNQELYSGNFKNADFLTCFMPIISVIPGPTHVKQKLSQGVTVSLSAHVKQGKGNTFFFS